MNLLNLKTLEIMCMLEKCYEINKINTSLSFGPLWGFLGMKECNSNET